MKSRNVLAAAIAVVLLSGAPIAVQAQQAPVKVVLKNVPALPGATGNAVGTVDGDPQQKAAIPLVGVDANLDAHGNIVVECLTSSGDCPNIGSGSGGAISGVPTLSFTVPTSAIASNDTSTRLQWSTGTTADACYGVRVEKKNAVGAWEAYTPPSGSTWSKEWPANGTASTGYVLGNLARSSTAGVDTEYRFTLRCYSKTVNDVGGTDAVAINERVSGTVTLASSGGTPPVGGSDYCSEYYPAGHPARSAPGFTVSKLTGTTTAFNLVFTSLDNGVLSFDQLIGTGPGEGRGGSPGPHVSGPNKYVAIPFTVPATVPALKVLKLTMVEPQNFLGLQNPVMTELSISPCPGDFRSPTTANTVSDWYARGYCRKVNNGSIFLSTGNLTGPASGANDACFLKPGAQMYINVTYTGLDGYRATGADPTPGCPSGYDSCGKKTILTRMGN